MLTVSDVSLRFSDRKLFDDVNIKFTEGNTYGLIGANGAGKSTFLKILARDIEPTTGHISLGPDERLSVLRQNHFDYEDERAIDVVIMGNEKLYSIIKEKDAIYMRKISQMRMECVLPNSKESLPNLEVGKQRVKPLNYFKT